MCEELSCEVCGHVLNCNFFSRFALLDVVVGTNHHVVLFQPVPRADRAVVRDFRREVRVGDLVLARGTWVEDDHESARLSVRGTRRLLVEVPPIVVKKRDLQVGEVTALRGKFFKASLPGKAPPQTKRDRRREFALKAARASCSASGADEAQEGVTAAAAAAAAVFNASVDDSKTRHRGCARKRGEIFASWIFNQLGKEALKSGGGVLDVAGGSGHLSMAFAMAGIRSTVVDPRDSAGALPRRDRKAMKKAIKHDIQVVPFAVNRSFFGGRIEGADDAFSGGSDVIAETRAELVEASSIILALHPDEATEAAVDTAIRYRKPWAVVPCCIFARLFPNRRLKSGGEVVSHEHWLQYLCEKQPGASVAKLDFEGKNDCVFFFGPYDKT